MLSLLFARISSNCTIIVLLGWELSQPPPWNQMTGLIAAPIGYAKQSCSQFQVAPQVLEATSVCKSTRVAAWMAAPGTPGQDRPVEYQRVWLLQQARSGPRGDLGEAFSETIQRDSCPSAPQVGAHIATRCYFSRLVARLLLIAQLGSENARE